MKTATKVKKSMIVAFLLTIFLGPLGSLYATIIGGIITTSPLLIILFYLNDITLAIGSTIVYLPFAWVISIIWGMIVVSIYNKRVEKAQYQNIIEAINTPTKMNKITVEATEEKNATMVKGQP